MGVAVWASGRLLSKPQTSQEINLKLQNKTAALKILGTRKIGEGDIADLEIVLVNQSNTIVLAYTFSSGESSLTSFGVNLGPGDSKTEKIPITNLEPSAEDKSMSELRLSAVYLQDGSTEGEKIDSSRLKSRMLGIQEQTLVALQVLRKASTSREPDPERLARTIADDLSSSSFSESDTEIASERLAGRAFVKEKVSREINNITSNRLAAGISTHDNLEALILSLEKLSGVPLAKR